MAPTICPNCGNDIRHIPAGVSKKTNKSYNEFWACENRECGYTWRPEKGEKTGDGNAILLDEIQAGFKELNERFDAMAKWLAEHIK